MKTRLLVLGATGMLGHAVAGHFAQSGGYELITTRRDDSLAVPGQALHFDALTDDLDSLPPCDYAINCIGVIKPFMAQSLPNAISLNALFPWRLADWCAKRGGRLIHITTDCVYSGAKGRYVESDAHDALDDYGKSKSLGEPAGSAMVLRTSIIGEEVHKYASLISWAKSQRGKRVQGYTTHRWNGVTTGEYARICDKIIRNDWFEPGLFHVFAADDVTKFEMMQLFNRKYNLGLAIDAASPKGCDRTLRTERDLCAKLQVPTVAQMIEAI